MLFFIANCSNNRKISISSESIDLVDFLNQISEQYDVQIFLTLKTPITLKNVCYCEDDLEDILKHICSSYNLSLKIDRDKIYITYIDEFWKTYYVKFFFEDDLSSLSSFFKDDRPYISNNFTNKHNNMYHDFEDNLQDNQVYNDYDFQDNKKSLFWIELEKNIKIITKSKYVIDKYNGVINIFGDSKTHQEISNYINYVNNNMYQQVLIECKVLEISSEINESIDIQPILSTIDVFLAKESITECVKKFITECQNLYKKIAISKTDDIHIKLMSQQTGRILSSNLDFFKEEEIIQGYNKNKITNDVIKGQYKKNEYGFSLSVSAIIIDDKNILLKLRPSLSMPKKDIDTNNNQPINLQRREFNTVIKTISGHTHTLGGLYLEYETVEDIIVTNIPVLRSLLNKKKNVRKKSYFVLFIKVTIC